MEDILDVFCDKDGTIDLMSKEYVYKYKEECLLQAIEHYKGQEAEINDLIEQDYHRQLHTEDTVMEYATILYRVRRILYYLNERLYSIDDMINNFQGMKT